MSNVIEKNSISSELAQRMVEAVNYIQTDPSLLSGIPQLARVEPTEGDFLLRLMGPLWAPSA